jgi:hypothetical protein
MKVLILTTTLGVSLLLAGCATTQQNSQAPMNSFGYIGPAKDRLLWQYKTSLVAMRSGDYVRAKELLDDAILSMGGIIAKDKNARQSRSYFHGESKKNFIGEPYERAMAYFYRAILYWMDGEPDNARACFRSAQLVDSDAVDKTYSADYTLLEYLDGFATAKLAGDGSDAFQRAKKLSKYPLRDYNTKANVLVFLEFGQGPLKYAGGEFSEVLLFSEPKSLAQGAIVKSQTQSVSAYGYDDLYFQATTRGGRVMDHILANKAGFKSATDTIGDASVAQFWPGASRDGRVMLMKSAWDSLPLVC